MLVLPPELPTVAFSFSCHRWDPCIPLVGDADRTPGPASPCAQMHSRHPDGFPGRQGPHDTTLGVSRPGHREVKPLVQSCRARKEQRRDLTPASQLPPPWEALAEPASPPTAGVLVPVLAPKSPGPGLRFPQPYRGWVGPSDGQVSSGLQGLCLTSYFMFCELIWLW